MKIKENFIEWKNFCQPNISAIFSENKKNLFEWKKTYVKGLNVGITKTTCMIVSTSGDRPERYFHSAHIYNNTMYVFGGRNGSQENNNQLWCLNLSKIVL